MATTRFSDHLLTGDHASRPAASAVPAGTLYACTTHTKVYQSDGSSAWSDWHTPASGSVATDTIWDAKGDVAVGSAADTASRLAVGTDGQVLTADSAQTLGVKWSTPSSGGSWTLLHTVTLGADTATIDQATISGSYNDLIVVLIARSANASAADTPLLRLNNDSGANYYYEWMRSTSTTVQGAEGIATTSFNVGTNGVPANSATANLFSFHEFVIPGYASTTWSKVVRATSATFSNNATGVIFPLVMSGIWNSTSAVTRVTFSLNSAGNYKTGSTMRIYGRT